MPSPESDIESDQDAAQTERMRLQTEQTNCDIGIIEYQLDRNAEANDDQRLPTRYVIATMTFMSSMFAYIVRASFSLNLLAMVNVYDANGTLVVQPNYGPRYDWSAYEQGLLLGAFYYVYPIASVPCGLIQDRYGIGREFIAVAFAVTAILCAISPLAAAVGAGSFGYLFAVRLLMGIAQGGTFSNLHRLVSRWAPRDELGTFAGSIIGSNVGTMLTWAMSGAIIESWGWQWSFHVAAMLVVVFVAVWWYAVYDSPAKHPRITLAEREYIENNLAATTSTLNKDWPPFGRMLTSCAFWALVGIQFANDWGLYFVITGVPRFLNQVLGFQISSTGLLAALPYLVRTFSSMCFGYVGDKARARNLVSLTNFRKLVCIVSHILPSLFLLGIPFVGVDQPYACIALMVLSFGFNGATTQSSLVNVHDLAPTMAATTNSLVNSVSATSGFMTPLVVAYFTSERNTIVEWRFVFVTGAAVYMLPAIFFMFFGSGVDQKWNDKRSNRNRSEVRMGD